MSCLLPCSSRPVVDVITLMSFSPAEIPVHEVECSYSTTNKKKEGVNITVCFQVKPLMSQFKGQYCLPAPQNICALPRAPHPPKSRLMAPGSATIQLPPFHSAQDSWSPTSLTLCSWMAIGQEAGDYFQEGDMNSAGT